ncbi:MAG: hypothetical protein ACTS45_01930 [Candidatus Hodgkinia cicadicola]
MNLDEFRRQEETGETNLNEGRRTVTKGEWRRRLFDWLSRGVCGIWTYCERESESIREVMCSRCNKCRGGPAGGWKRAKLKTPAGYIGSPRRNVQNIEWTFQREGAFRLRIRMQMRAKRMNT